MKEESELEFKTEFPKITICLNSMHSRRKVNYSRDPNSPHLTSLDDPADLVIDLKLSKA